MKVIKNNKGIETLVFAETFEQEAYDQVKKLINFEAYENSKIRIMPDSHAGKGCTVGTTMTITDKVTPNLVSVDIGCGMLSVKFSTKFMNLEKLDEIIKNKIPSGFEIHTTSKAKFDFSGLKCYSKVDIGRAILSLGSLGSGNHFIELCENQLVKNEYYLVIHTGSRKLGGDVCKYYQELAIQNKEENSLERENLIKKLKREGKSKEIASELKKIEKPVVDKDLAYLEGENFKNYMNDMSITQKYASLNRETIANIILKELGDVKVINKFETIHNYIDFKRMILRKGAVSAEKGEILLIPINMRDGSLLCIGKGNEDWNYSAPHGAGRLMSRGKAKELINFDDYVESMKGIYSSSVVQSTLDEAPQAYKSIEEIKSAVTETVDIIEVIKPIYNFKAH